jgi:hypothetical protein
LCDPHSGGLAALIGDISPDLSPRRCLGRLQVLYRALVPGGAAARDGARLADGWFRIQSGDSCVVGNFPVGEFPVAYPTHGHADLTSFAWSAGARDLLVDRGRFRYTADAVSAFQRQAAAHNLPLVNGLAPLCERLAASAAWYPLPYAAARLEADAVEGGIVLSHDGFARATPVSLHTRRLELERDRLTIEDSFAGSGRVGLTFGWHFAEGFERFDVPQLTVSGGAGRIALTVSGAEGSPETAIVCGEPCGWTSPVYGSKRGTLGVWLHWRVSLPAQICTSFAVV